MSVHRPTLASVAEVAGVSISTASLAFAASGPIAEKTRARVMAAAEELGYRGPNPLGRQLRSGRSGIVGVVIGDKLRRSFRDPVSVQVLDGLASTLGSLGLGVLLIPGTSDEEGLQTVDPLIETAAMDVAILIWGVHANDKSVEALERRGVPMVVGEGRPLEGAPLVGIDDRGGTAELTRYLTDLGHERIAVVSLPFSADRRSGEATSLDDIEWTPTRNRLAGMHDAGVDPVLVWETEASLVEHGHAAAMEVLSPERWPDVSQRPTALVAQSDLLAAGAILGARELGLRVPEDVSIAGFDGLDLPWLGADVLTTVRQPLADKGAALGHAVEGILAGDEPTVTILGVELVVGTTTAPPAQS
ncbi:LacI family DNA-binding transcriptional regulator [Sanguibacter inulinus]|uniref:LacI family DNA-binding transcriptional regulator n=1 Tax=Sanguibacter inulinus TaxID=60922 RepID=A0A853EXT4_9MICO|nr:LacI family DNA-binding transcriptional regulator [Sanguibacter inulinus]MBF0722523.1 LacI family DNA-binding transcriptional regulator [Sanguibacter inulinus]NYS93668.1 LacI family DNA-binding transcriptional regulator [Sanguibacter inulinus]